MRPKIFSILGVAVFCAFAFFAFSDPPMGPMKYNLYTTNNTGAIDSHVSSLVASGGRTNWAVSSITNAGTAAYSNSVAFVLSAGSSATNLVVDLRSGSKLSLKLNTAQYDFIRSGSSMMISNTADGSTIEFNKGLIFRDSSVTNVLGKIDTSSGTSYGAVFRGAFSGNGNALTNLNVGQVYGGTSTARNAFTPNTSFALWVVTDSTPPFQLSVWSGGIWN